MKKGAILILSLIFLIVVSITMYMSLRENSDAPKRIGILVHTESIGGKGTYELYSALKQQGHTVKIIAIPSYYFGRFLADIDHKFLSKFPQEDVLYPCGKKAPYKSCSSIDYYQLEYIFSQNPYDTFSESVLDPSFTINHLKKKAKLAFIVYGPHIFHQDMINDKKFPDKFEYVFVDSQSTKDIYVKKYGMPKDRVVVSGYINYKTTRDALSRNRKNSPHTETILWMPRWTLGFSSRDLFEGGSTFLNYYLFFYKYATEHPHVNLIIRPHVLLFSTAVKEGHMTQNDLDAILQKFRSLPNVVISDHGKNPLEEDIIASDVVISDGTSALAEVVVANKPIIYLSNGWNNEFNSNELSKDLKKFVYMAYNPKDIIKFLDEIKRNNYLPWKKKELKKRKAFKEKVDPIKDPAEHIAKFLLNN